MFRVKFLPEYQSAIYGYFVLFQEYCKITITKTEIQQKQNSQFNK